MKSSVAMFDRLTLDSFMFSCVMMIFDSMTDSLKHSVKHTLLLYTPINLTLGLFFATTQLTMYKEQRALMILFFNLIIAVMTFNLMVHNMSGKAFSMFQPIVLLAAVPLMVDLAGLEMSKEQE